VKSYSFLCTHSTYWPCFVSRMQAHYCHQASYSSKWLGHTYIISMTMPVMAVLCVSVSIALYRSYTQQASTTCGSPANHRCMALCKRQASYMHARPPCLLTNWTVPRNSLMSSTHTILSAIANKMHGRNCPVRRLDVAAAATIEK
jgi:hypothetical protein